MLRRTSSACFEPIDGSGCSGLPLQFRPAISTPVPSNRPRKSSRAASEVRMSSKVGMCTGGRKPPEFSSMPDRPSPAMTLIASGSERSCRIAL